MFLILVIYVLNLLYLTKEKWIKAKKVIAQMIKDYYCIHINIVREMLLLKQYFLARSSHFIINVFKIRTIALAIVSLQSIWYILYIKLINLNLLPF